jgi:hypothetical protein
MEREHDPVMVAYKWERREKWIDFTNLDFSYLERSSIILIFHKSCLERRLITLNPAQSAVK